MFGNFASSARFTGRYQLATKAKVLDPENPKDRQAATAFAAQRVEPNLLLLDNESPCIRLIDGEELNRCFEPALYRTLNNLQMPRMQSITDVNGEQERHKIDYLQKLRENIEMIAETLFQKKSNLNGLSDEEKALFMAHGSALEQVNQPYEVYWDNNWCPKTQNVSFDAPIETLLIDA